MTVANAANDVWKQHRKDPHQSHNALLRSALISLLLISGAVAGFTCRSGGRSQRGSEVSWLNICVAFKERRRNSRWHLNRLIGC